MPNITVTCDFWLWEDIFQIMGVLGDGLTYLLITELPLAFAVWEGSGKRQISCIFGRRGY